MIDYSLEQQFKNVTILVYILRIKLKINNNSLFCQVKKIKIKWMKQTQKNNDTFWKQV